MYKVTPKVPTNLPQNRDLRDVTCILYSIIPGSLSTTHILPILGSHSTQTVGQPLKEF